MLNYNEQEDIEEELDCEHHFIMYGKSQDGGRLKLKFFCCKCLDLQWRYDR